MAKQSNNERLDLDSYDFGDEFNFDEFSLEPKPVKTKREAIERIGEGVWEGTKDTVKSPSFFREFIKKALPRGYGDMVDLLDQGASSVRELYNEGEKEAKPLLRDVSRAIDKMMPASSKYLPKSAEKLLKDFADRNREQTQAGVGANSATDLAVAAMLADTFRYGAKEDTRREAKQDARETIRDAVENDRFNSNIAQLDGIRKSVVSMAAYQRRVEFGYHKKSLELQARQYFVNVEMLNEMKRSNLRTGEMLSGILHNTALPDVVKLKTSEKFKDMLRNKLMAGLQDGIFGQRNNFVQNLGKAFREQALGSLQHFIGGARDGITGAEMASDSMAMAQDMGMDKFRMAGNVVGGEGAKWLGKLAATRLGKRISESTSRHTQSLRRFGNRLQHGVENAPQIATDWSNTASDASSSIDQFLENRFGERLSDNKRRFLSNLLGGVGDPLMDLAKGTIRRTNSRATQVKEGGVGDLYTPAVFNNQAHKSLVEVIPGYLARIYQELQIQRTGDTSIDLAQYDYASGRFSTTRAVRQATFHRLFDESSRNGVKYERERLLELVDPRGELTPEQRKELADRLMQDNLRGRAGYETGRISNYTRAGSFGESRHGDKFAELFKRLAEKDKTTEGATNVDFAARFRGVGRSAANRENEIQQLLEVYPRDLLEDMGLLKPGSSQIDTAKINAYFGGDVYTANGVPGLAGAGRRRIRQGGANTRLTHAESAPITSMADEVKRLIEIIELQNTKPLVSDIKEILLAMQADLHHPGGAGPSTLDRVIDGVGSATRATAQAAQRTGRQFMNQNQRRVAALVEQAKRRARRAQRRATVGAGRLQQRYQPQLDAVRDMWDHRDEGLSHLGGMLRNRWDQWRGYAEEAYDHLHGDEFRDQVRQARTRAGNAMRNAQTQARGVGEQLLRNVQGQSEALRQAAAAGREKNVFTEIKEILLAIRDRLEDGIITTGGVPPEGVLRRAGGATRRGLSRLNMRLTDLVKGGFGLVSGTARLGGRVVNGLVGGSARLGWGLAKGTAGLAGDAVGFAVSSQYRRARGFVDIYVGNERKPRLYGRMLQEGNVYFDKESGKPIRRLKDIVGDVVRHTAEGEQLIMSAEEIEHAWQKIGPVKKTLKALGVTAKSAYGIGKKIFGVAMDGVPPVFRMAMWGAKKAWGLLDMAQDIFVRDRLDSPAMTARLMRAGSYYSATSWKVIKRPSQIDGPVLIGEGDQAETVLTHDDLRKGLVDKNGKTIRTGLSKLLFTATAGIRKVTGLAWRVGKQVNAAAVGLVKNGIKLGKAAVKTGVNTIGGAFDLLRGKNPFAQKTSTEVLAASAHIQLEQNSFLKEIRDLLRERLPKPKEHSDWDSNGDGIRDGSYEDQLRQKAEAEGAQAPMAKGPGVGARIKNGAKALWGKLRGKKDEDGEEGGDINVTAGGGNTGETRDERRKRRMARRPGGSWATSKGWKGKGKFLLGKAGGLLKGVGKFGLGLLGLGELGLGGVLAGAGGMLASGAAAVGGALATAGTAIAGVLSAPVLLGAAAVAGVAAGAYFGYKYLTRKKLGLLSRVRYVQYGFAPQDTDHLAAVFGLEDKLKDAIIYGKDEAKLDPKRCDPMTLFKDFDVSQDDKTAMENWIHWFSVRFKPIFLTHAAGLKAVAGDKWLSDVDGLEPAVALQYLNAVRCPDGAYNDGTSPFKDLDTLKMGAGDVQAIIQLAERELKRKAPDAQAAGVVAAGAVGATAVAKAGEVAVGSTTPGGVSAKALAQAGLATSVQPAKGAQVMASGSSVVLESLGVNKLDGVDVVRFKAYGLVKMELDKVRALQALEKALTPKLSYVKNVATWSGSVEQQVLVSGAAFGVDTSNDAMTANWISWFNQRFLPVFLNYASLMKAQTGKDDPVEGKSLLKAAQAVDVATALYTTSTNGGSIWNVSVSPWEGYALNTDVRSTDGNLQGLKDMAKAVILTEPGGKGANQPTAGKSTANSQTTPAVTPSTGVWGSIKDFWKSTSNAVQAAVGSNATVATGQVVTNPNSMNGNGMAGGREMNQPGRGTGGDINAIPKPQGNKSWAALKDTILAAAKMVGVDGKLMAAMAAVESGFDYSVKAAKTSATGLYQFVANTWNWMLKKYGAKYGIAPGTPATDPRANALMGAEYLKESVNALEGKIGRPLTDTDIYFSHFLGPAGAKKFLTADPNALGAMILPEAAAANRSIFYSRNGGPLTVGQIYQLVNSRLQNKSQGLSIDGGEATVATQATEAPPATAKKDDGKATAPKPAFGLGMPGLPGNSPSPTTAQAPAPVSSTSTQVPVAPSAPAINPMLGGGFMPPTRTQDQLATAQQQMEVRVANLTDTNKILSDSYNVQRDSLKVLEQIRDGLGKLNVAPSAPTPTPVTPVAGSPAVMARQRQSSELPRAPVSVARPAAPF
jgi:hypothetical protein